MISDPAEWEGAAARVWRFGVEKVAESDGRVIGMLLAHAPHAHPFWAWHTISIASLAVWSPGTEPPTKWHARADYEIAVFALDPHHEPTSLSEPVTYMLPPDFVAQFAGDRGRAEALLAKVAHEVAAGQLVPDSDYRNHWRRKLAAWLGTANVFCERTK